MAQVRPSSIIRAPRTWDQPDKHFGAALHSPWYRLIFKMYSTFVYTTNDFFREMTFAPALMPVTCGSISSPMGLGSDSLPVSIELFGAPTYLADSMQFHLEYLLRHGDRGVFYIMPTFRGEDHDARHLNQFFHSEAEMIGDLSNVMSLVSRYVLRLATDFLSVFGDSLVECGIGTDHLEQMIGLKGVIPEVSFKEACKILGSDPLFYEPLRDGLMTLSRRGEHEIMRQLGGITWLSQPPKASVPFYQADSDDGIHARCADLLFGIGEVVGCGERHSTYEATLNALLAHEVDPKEYEWYLRMKREYPLGTAGFGLGLERFLLWVLKHGDIRDLAIISRLKGMESAP